jgi:hypothetical protein
VINGIVLTKLQEITPLSKPVLANLQQSFANFKEIELF